MYAVIFEVKPTKEGKAEYLKIAAGIKHYLENREGSVLRLQELFHHNRKPREQHLCLCFLLFLHMCQKYHLSARKFLSQLYIS
jgi:hypothetical protein